MEPDQVMHSDPEIMSGVLVFCGTRVPVAALVDHLKAGDTLDEFLAGFPSVSREQAVGFLDGAASPGLGVPAQSRTR
ncbi:MAG TPA: DUF433 domain-containing protein [Armatimonadota bacterium]|nr:DUF433 domain-containing protein [Armatimonadota bacterium]